VSEHSTRPRSSTARLVRQGCWHRLGLLGGTLVLLVMAVVLVQRSRVGAQATGWTAQNAGTTQRLFSVPCSTADLCVAVGSSGTIVTSTT
jgi:hypothetical protein